MAKGSNDPLARGGRRQRKANDDHAVDPIANATPPKREDTLMRLLDTMPVLMLETDSLHRVTFMNARFAEIAGYQLGETLPFDVQEPHPFWRKPDAQEPFRWDELPIARVWATGTPVEDILLSRTLPSGEEVSLLAKAQPVHDAAGQMISAIVVLVDITAQRQAERRAMEHAELMDAVFRSIHDGIVIYDLQGNASNYNPAALHILGWDVTNIDPRSLSQEERAASYKLFSSTNEELPLEQWPMERVLRGEGAEPIEISARRQDGTRVIIMGTAAPLRDRSTGAIFGAVSIFRDMTELYRLEQMREEFINVASHELRTPLTSLGLANHLLQQWLRRIPDSGTLLDLSATIHVQMKRMERLINNMLDLTSITGGNFHITARPADLAKVVRTAVEEQRGTTKREIRLSGVEGPLAAQIDAQRISQVITNLVVNALAHSPPATPIEVRLEQTQREKTAWARISVRDYGKGIPADQRAVIFERFGSTPVDKAQDGEDSSVNGLRFGLFLARMVVLEHGGEIWVESQPGRGSAFIFEIPLTPPKEQSS